MSNLTKLLKAREQTRRVQLLEITRVLVTHRIPIDYYQRVRHRHEIAYEDSTWALRGWKGTVRPRIGVDVAKPSL